MQFNLPKPLFDRVLIHRDKPETQIGAIHLPSAAKEPPNTGTIIAVGEGRLCPSIAGLYQKDDADNYCCIHAHVEPLRLKVSDRVMFHSYAGTQFNNPTNGESYVLCKEDDVIGLIMEVPNVGTESDRSGSGNQVSQA